MIISFFLIVSCDFISKSILPIENAKRNFILATDSTGLKVAKIVSLKVNE